MLIGPTSVLLQVRVYVQSSRELHEVLQKCHCQDFLLQIRIFKIGVKDNITQVRQNGVGGVEDIHSTNLKLLINADLID
jgi:hypothetical protein